MCITEKELNKKVSEIRALKALKEETENEIKALERDIISFMVEMKLPEHIGSDYKVTYKEQIRKSLDKTKLEADLKNLSNYEKTTTYEVLRIK